MKRQLIKEDVWTTNSAWNMLHVICYSGVMNLNNKLPSQSYSSDGNGTNPLTTARFGKSLEKQELSFFLRENRNCSSILDTVYLNKQTYTIFTKNRASKCFLN